MAVHDLATYRGCFSSRHIVDESAARVSSDTDGHAFMASDGPGAVQTWLDCWCLDFAMNAAFVDLVGFDRFDICMALSRFETFSNYLLLAAEHPKSI